LATYVSRIVRSLCDANSIHSANLGLPHKVNQDDEYEGMFIPKNSTVFPGIWAVHQNDSIYPEAENFNPDRFLGHPKLASEYSASSNPDARDHFGYGAGRRICPGMHLAERSMWRITAKLLWAYEISEPLDPVTGKLQPLDINAFNTGILMCPKPFRVRLVPRSDKHLAAIKRDLTGSLSFLSQWE
jgi:cytochrome P450